MESRTPLSSPFARGVIGFKALLWLLLLAAGTWLALMPAIEVPKAISFWDKAQHSLAYAGLGLIGLWALPRRRLLVLLALAAHGGLVELAQATFTTTRQGEWMDWVADLSGLLLAALLVLSLSWLMNRLGQARATR